MVHKQSGQPNSLKQQKFLKKLEKMLLAIEEELVARKNVEECMGIIAQLEKIKAEIECMRKTLSYKEFLPTYPRTLVDSWDYTNHLGIQLLELYEDYIKL